VTFAALRHRNYRLLRIGTLISQTGDWMDQIALNWLVLQMTGSPVEDSALLQWQFDCHRGSRARRRSQ